ncbi:MAG: PAS domain S-box protein [Bacteroidetes bacterium]|nr:PAS domain S-box protein [Bacteroidota bacterium]
MKVFKIHLKVLTGFAIAIAGIGFFLYTTYTNSQLSITDSQNITHHLKVMKISEKLLDDVQDMETGYRGFLITGNHDYLTPTDSAFRSLPSHLNELTAVTAGYKSEEPSAKQLSTHITSMMAYAKKIIALRKENRNEEAVSEIKTNEGIRLMDKIRSNIAILEENGRTALNESNRKKEEIAHETKQNFIILALVIFFKLILVYLIIAGDLKKNDSNKQQLLIANKKILDLFDEAPCGYLSLNKDGVIIEINKTALSWLGFDIEEIKDKKKFSELTPNNYRLTIESLITKASLVNHEIELTTVNGKIIPFLIDSRINYNKEGEIIYIRTVLTDIKERKKAEAKASYLATLIENTNDSIISVDKSLIIKSWNKGAEKLFCKTAFEAVGNSLFEFLKIPTSHDLENEMWNDLISRGKWVIESSHDLGKEKPVYIQNSVSIFNQNNDTNFILIFISQDISTQKEYENTLKDFNQKLQSKVIEQTEEISSIFNRISEGFASFDNNFNVIFANPYTEKLIGISREKIIGMNFLSFFKGAKNPNILNKIKKSKEENKNAQFEEYSEYFKKWIHVKVYPSPGGTTIFFQDITDRKLSETKLIENEKKYRLLFQNNPIPMWIIELSNFTILDVNKAAIDHYGYSPDEFIGKDVTELRPPEEIDKFKNLSRIHSESNFNAGIWTHIKKNGERIKVEILAYSMVYDEKKCRLILSNDITEKLKSREELEASRDQLRNLSSYLEKVREAERTNIAREIHDELGQQLTGLKMDVSWISKKIKSDDAAVNEKIQGMTKLIDDTVKTVRKIASELRPGILDDLGLVAALDWQSKEFEKRTGIKCYFTSDNIEYHFNKNISTGIFRIYQEALTNVARHSKASRVESSIVINNDEMIDITIKDNGIGMSNENSGRSTLGLVGMKERAFMMDGQLIIDSQEGNGTRINLKIPYHN